MSRPSRTAPATSPARPSRAIFARWLESGLFHPEPEGTAEENYSIAIPPPNVTGALHMGHALNGSVQDTLIRYNRMRGRRDAVDPRHRPRRHRHPDAGRAAAQREGTSREEIGREAFIERVWQLARGVRRHDHRSSSSGSAPRATTRTSASRSTTGYVRAVLKVFVDLYDKGLIYRDNYMVNWDPGSRSAISDLEVEEREVTDTLYYVDYPLERPAAARSRSPPCGRRRCWPTPRSPSTPTTTATRGWWGRPRSCRSSAAACGSSPTRTSSPSSAPAR